MQTERLYYGTETSFKAEIKEIRPFDKGGPLIAVLLDRTIFYPEGGGQGADRGSINGRALLDVQEKDGEILHIVSADNADGLVPGPVELVVDAERRRDFTVQHTAQHLLSGTILRLSGKPTVSMHLGDEINTIDVDSPELSGDLLLNVEETAARAIEEDHPVIIHLCPPEDVKSFPLRKTPPQGEDIIRVVEIKGNDFSPCCGTHCRSTGQIGILRVLGAEKYKGMTRVSFIAGRRCLYDSRILRRNADIVSRSLKVPLTETGKGVLALLEKTAGLERQIKILEDENALFKAEALLKRAGLSGFKAESSSAGSAPSLVLEKTASSFDEMLRIGRAAQKLTEAKIILISESDLKFAAFCSAKGEDLRPLLKALMEQHGGRGGGSSSFFQGQFTAGKDLAAFADSLRRMTGM
jgi:alanyl-tRNA synthetase